MSKTPRDPLTEIPIAGLEEFTADFLISRKEELAGLYTALGENNFKFISAICHTWKGFAVPYGFGELAHLAVEMEESCERKDTSECQRILKDIEDYLSSK